MNKILVCALLLVAMSTGTVYSEEAGCLQTKNNWIIRVNSEGVATYGFVLKVYDPATGNLISHDTIKAFSGATPPFQCLNPDSATTNECVIESNAQSPDVSLACDAAAGTAYIFHDSAGQQSLTTISDITLVSVGSPVLTPSTTLLSFGSVSVNATKNLSVVATNTGNADLHITSVSSPATPFSKVTDTCSVKTLLPSGTCTITIQFAPKSATVFNGSFNILSDGGTATISLSGTGTATGGGPR